jgi:eukaryotic-like serine/threonine-protein kinase
MEGKSPLETARLICEQDPTVPIAAASSADRKWLRGDLDAIVLKAMRKEPARRYASVGQFAGDIQAYLEGYPGTAAATRGLIVHPNSSAAIRLA